MHHSLKISIEKIKNGQARHLFALSKCTNLIHLLSHELQSICLSTPEIINLNRSSEKHIRSVFTQAICTGKPVIASGLETLSVDVLLITIDYLAAIHQWNSNSFGIGISKEPIFHPVISHSACWIENIPEYV